MIKLLCLTPYLMICCGLGMGYLRVRPAMLGWAMCMLGVLSGLIVAVVILAIGNAHLWILAIIAVLPTVVAAAMISKDLSYPRINDVTTDVDTPPTFVAALEAGPNRNREMAFPERFAPIVREHYRRVRPLLLEGSLAEIFKQTEDLAKRQKGWRLTHRDFDSLTLEFEASTSVLGFIDDVAIKVADQDGKARVDMRSKSREGLVDAGKNANRIVDFLNQLERASRK